MVRVGSHDNSTEAGERALGKGLSSHHPGFEGPEGVITKGIAPTVGYPCSMIALRRLFFALMSGSCYFRRLVNDNTVSAGETQATWQTFS